MKNIGFITNIEKDPALKDTLYLAGMILDRGCNVYMQKKYEGKLSLKINYVTDEEFIQSVDIIVVMGGDGTILGASRLAAPADIPILGINLGTLGYLADVERSMSAVALEKVFNGDYTIEKRMMLKAYIEGKDEKPMLALNDVCITNSVLSRIITLGVEVSGAYINTFRSDGLIISSPTGSTAYNLSAGGPILSPKTELIALTHICPHALYSRPFVVSGSDVIRINIKSGYEGIKCSCDGQTDVGVKSGDTVVVEKADCYASIIKTSELSFYDILRRKMVNVVI